MNKFYFTFGSGQEHDGKYFVIEATSSDLARKEMFETFGQNWSWEYSEDQWFEDGKPLSEIWGWEELKLS